MTIPFGIDRLGFMNKQLKILLIISIITGIIFSSCQSNTLAQEPVEEAEVLVAPEEPIKEEPAPAVPEKESEELVVNDETGFEVSKEVYEQTLDEIRELINTLNNIISSKNYSKWKRFLSDEYIKTYNDPVKLNQISQESQILAENGIVLNNLKDYFEWVVVPSRSAARVDDIVFSNDSQLIVYMIIREKHTILYQLEKINEKWQISIW